MRASPGGHLFRAALRRTGCRGPSFVIILHVAETARGGVGTYIGNVLRHPALNGELIQSYAVVPRSHLDVLGDLPDARLRPYARRSRSPSSLLNLAMAVLASCRELRPDVVHAHSTFAGLLVRLLRLVGLLRAPVVFSPHGWSFYVAARPALKRSVIWLERALAPLLARYVLVAEAERADGAAAGLPSSKMTVVMNGVAAERPSAIAHRWTDTRLKALFIGRFDRQKGTDLLIQAASRLEIEVAFLFVGSHVVGDQPLGKPTANVSLHPWTGRNEIEGMLDSCDLVVLPSRWEGLSLVAVEAMRAGKPLLCTRVGGMGEVVVPGRSGWLIQPGSADAIVEGLRFMTACDLPAMGVEARQLFERAFTLDRVADQLGTVYREVVGDPRQGPRS